MKTLLVYALAYLFVGLMVMGIAVRFRCNYVRSFFDRNMTTLFWPLVITFYLIAGVISIFFGILGFFYRGFRRQGN